MSEETTETQNTLSDKELNFRRLEAERQKDREERDRERDARIRTETELQIMKQQMEDMHNSLRSPEPDPFDDLDEYLDPEAKKKIEAKFNKLQSNWEKSASEVARKEYERREKEKEEEDKKNFLPKLQKKYTDYDQVMNEENIQYLAKNDELFLKSTLKNPDEFERREMTYQRIKALKASEQTPEKSVSDIIEKNQKNPYHVPASAAPTSAAVEFDTRSKEARESAYARLKAAQKNPIGVPMRH